MRDSLRGRLLVWYSVVVTTILTLFGATVCYIFWRSLLARVDDGLTARAVVVARALRPAGDGSFDLDLPDESRDYFGQERRDQPYYAIWTAGGRQVDVSDPQVPLVRPREPGALVRDGRREVTIRGPAGAIVLVGRDLTRVRGALRSLVIMVTIAGLGALVMSIVCGWFMAGRALAPIARINRTARAMAGGDFAARIPIDRTETELGQVALAVNTAFDRLDEAIERQRQFTADASHELRTPLATLLAETEWALTRDRTAPQYRESLTTCRSAAARMRALVEGLLTLARADANQLKLQHVPVSVQEVVHDVVTLVRPIAERAGIRITASVAPIEVDGDPERLRQAVTNLATNAVQYNRSGGLVEIQATDDSDDLVLRVADSGAGIAPEHLPHIFERFYRADRARAAPGGAGLGLALTKWIVERHGGTIACASEPGGGTEFVVRLPHARRISGGPGDERVRIPAGHVAT